MARLRKSTVLLIVASLVYVVLSGFLYFSYVNSIKEQYLAAPPEMRPYLDFAPFHGSREGIVVVVYGALMGMVWVLHLSKHKKSV